MQSDVEKILPKLGFSIEDADKLVGNFSGGWQMKIALGKIILQKPDLLLLDEPTKPTFSPFLTSQLIFFKTTSVE